MKRYDYETAHSIAREGIERAIETALNWLSVDNTLIGKELAENDREYISIDMCEYVRIMEGVI